MREILLVAQREFDERVRTRSFMVGTALFPLLVLGIIALPGRGGDPGERRVVVVDQAPQPLGDLFVRTVTNGFFPGLDAAQPAPREAAVPRYDVERIERPLDQVRPDLTARLAAGQIDAWVILPRDLRESGRVELHVRSVADATLNRDIGLAASAAVQADRLARSPLHLDDLTALLAPAQLDVRSGNGGEAVSAPRQEAFYFAFVVALLTYLLIALYGTSVTRSVIEEKNNRIAEVLVSSMRATHLLAGKIAGVGSAVLLQVLIWITIFGLMVARSEWIAARLGTSPAALHAVLAAPGTTALLLGYFILGFLLFVALFAALGAAVTSDQEAQAYQMLLMLPLFVPLVFLVQLTSQPQEPLARLLALIPLTSPVAMPMRMGSSHVPAREILLSLLLLALSLALVAWLAGKIYRVGILATGRRATLREVVQWLRSG